MKNILYALILCFLGTSIANAQQLTQADFDFIAKAKPIVTETIVKNTRGEVAEWAKPEAWIPSDTNSAASREVLELRKTVADLKAQLGKSTASNVATVEFSTDVFADKNARDQANTTCEGKDAPAGYHWECNSAGCKLIKNQPAQSVKQESEPIWYVDQQTGNRYFMTRETAAAWEAIKQLPPAQYAHPPLNTNSSFYVPSVQSQGVYAPQSYYQSYDYQPNSYMTGGYSGSSPFFQGSMRSSSCAGGS